MRALGGAGKPHSGEEERLAIRGELHALQERVRTAGVTEIERAWPVAMSTSVSKGELSTTATRLPSGETAKLRRLLFTKNGAPARPVARSRLASCLAWSRVELSTQWLGARAAHALVR